MLKVKNIHKSFGKHEVLKGIDLNVEKSDIIVILGPSGSGKTTLLKCINFLEKADEGSIDLDGIQVDCRHPLKKSVYEIRKQIGFVFQNYNLFQNKTALENVTEGLIVARKIEKAKAIEIAKSALDGVGLSDRYDYYPSKLSGGQQQRVGIARAIAASPKLILFDEPTSALDTELVGEVLKVMKKLAEDGVTMVVVSHEIDFAREVANKVMFIDEGRVIEEGIPKEVLNNPKELRTRQFLSRVLHKD